MSLKLNSSGGGSVTLQEPVTASTLTLTLPAFSGTAATLASVTNNGVLFVNSSGQPTSGSALTFDGNTLTATHTSGNAIIASRGGKDLRFSGNYADANTHAVISTTTGMALAFMDESSELMRLTSTGLGIGTSSPAKRLDVRQAYTADTVVGQIGNINNGNGATPSATLFDFTVNNGTPVSRIGSVYTQALGQAYLSFSTYGSGSLSERMRIDSAGNLGLGVTPSAWGSPYKALQVGTTAVFGGNAASNRNYSSSNVFWNGSSYRYITTSQATQFEQSDGAYYWLQAPSGTAGNAISFTQAMTLSADGYLGLVTTSPQYPLDVQQKTSDDSYALQLRGYTTGADGTRTANMRTVSSNAGDWANFRMDASSFIWRHQGVTERARIDSSGNLLVGSTSGFGARIHAVTASASGCISTSATASSGNRYHLVFYENTTERGSVTSNGGGVVYNSVSDYRLKENVAPMTGALAKVAQLNPVTYTWKDSGSSGEGFIAHELQEVCPNAVTGEKDAVDQNGKPKYQGIDTSILVATLTAAIQEQQAMIVQLQADIASLKGTA